MASSRFTSENAREAARKSAEVRRAKREAKRKLAEQEAAGGSGEGNEGAPSGLTAASAPVSRPTDKVDLAVVAALERKAQQGDVAAAKELRAWREVDPEAAADADALRIAAIVVRLDRDLRDELRLWLLAAAERPAKQQIREGTIDGFDSPPTVHPPTTPESAEPDATPPNDGTPAASLSAPPSAELEKAETPAPETPAAW